MALKSALFALKFSLTWAVPSFNMPTLTAFLGRITRVYNTNMNAFAFSLVGNKCLKLGKTPSMQSPPESLPKFGSPSNICKILKYQRCIATYRLHQPLTQHMITISPKPFLSARNFFQALFGRFCANGIEAYAATQMF